MNQEIPFIESIIVDLFEGLFNTEVKFNNGLNIVGGENGTGKTQLIQLLKNSPTRKFFNDISTERIVVFNPLRNAERRTQEQIVQNLRSQDLSIKKINEALKGFAINDSQLTTYYSFGELFVLAYEDLFSENKGSIGNAVGKTKEEFNNVLQQIFFEYEITADWKDKKLLLSVKKQNGIQVPLEALSRGEREVLALIFNIYANRNEQDIFLIDEPEIHLNWSLERSLFRFLNWFCEKFNKQIIAATHSRVIFESEFISKAQFLVWENRKIVVKEKPTDEIKTKIGGDALQLVTALDINKAAFYVEDNVQKQVVEFLSKCLSKDIFVFPTGGKENVKNLCRYFAKEDIQNAYFLVDSDNEGVGDEFKDNNNYVQLQKYCIENYFLNPSILAKITGKTKKEIKNSIKDAIINAAENKNTKVFKKLAESTEISEEILETYNAKIIIDQMSSALKFRNKTDLMNKFLELCKKEKKLDNIFKEITEKINKI
ncbi:MAG: AAA family ATPase [Candidatus Levybacteria bacterium]|nr:AAA family ATPase [Candidatus Levybacteria bacterium]